MQVQISIILVVDISQPVYGMLLAHWLIQRAYIPIPNVHFESKTITVDSLDGAYG